MKPITIKEAEVLSSPNPFALVVTCDAAGKPNLMALSWWTYASNNPPTVVVCLSRRGYSGQLIAANKEFSLCLPDETLQQAAFACGTCSGRDTDKAEKFGIELADASVIAPKLVKHSRAAMECRVVSTAEAGDHWLFVAEVVAACGDPDARHLMATGGYRALEAF